MSLTPESKKPVKEIKLTRDLSVGLFPDGKIMTMIRGERFVQCRKAIFSVMREGDIGDRMGEYRNMDDFLSKRSVEEKTMDNARLGTDPEVELFVHASTLQGWVESGYNIDVIDTRIAFPILVELSSAGDIKAKKALFDEVYRRWSEGSDISRRALMQNNIGRDVLRHVEIASNGYEKAPEKDKKFLASSSLTPQNILMGMAKSRAFAREIAMNRGAGQDVLEYIIGDAGNDIFTRNEAIATLHKSKRKISRETRSRIIDAIDDSWKSSDLTGKENLISMMVSNNIPGFEPYVDAKKTEYFALAKATDGFNIRDLALLLVTEDLDEPIDWPIDWWLQRLIVEEMAIAKGESYEMILDEVEDRVVSGWDRATVVDRSSVIGFAPVELLMKLIMARKIRFVGLSFEKKKSIIDYFRKLSVQVYDQYARKKGREFIEFIRDDLEPRVAKAMLDGLKNG